VGTIRFSRLAESDLLSIGSYTLRTWGEAQTLRYIDALEACCQQLADNPASGRSCDDIRPGLLSQGARQACDFLPARAGGNSGFPHFARAHAAGQARFQR
jgi:plasmid stabilization system protein ParE